MQRQCGPAPSTSPCFAKKERYYGFKLHLITTENGLHAAFSITSSQTHDVKAFEELIDQTSITGATVLVDKGYISNPLQLHLCENKKLTLKAQPRVNMKTPIKWTAGMAAVRRRIDAAFSQCLDQFRRARISLKPSSKPVPVENALLITTF